MTPSEKALFKNLQKLALKIIDKNRESDKLERVNSIINKMCALEVLKVLNGLSPNPFQNYFMRVNVCDYRQVQFVNLSMSCLGIFRQSSDSFLEMCKCIGIEAISIIS